MEVFLDNRQSKVDIGKDTLDTLTLVVEESLRLEGVEGDLEVSISFVDNQEIRTLNKEYRGEDRITDVLSFPIYEEPLIPIRLLGDIIISVEKALKQSKEYNHSLERELSYLTCHSMLHLLGYDHIDPGGKEVMREKEKTIMKNLNIFRGDKGI